MSSAALEDRTFESAVALEPEQVAANKEHFEGKGYTIEIEDEGAPAPPAGGTATPPEPPEPAAIPPVETVQVPVEGAVPPEVDDDTRAEWQTLKNDGEKLGKHAKKTKLIKEQAAQLATKDGQIEELRRQLDARGKQATSPEPTAPAPTSTTGLSEGAPPKVEPAKPDEPAKAKTFDKARPVLPKFEEFREADDPIAAHADAVAEFNEKLSDWKDEKRDFEAREARAVQDSEVQAQQRVKTESAKRVEATVSKGKEAHADFLERTNAVKYTPVMQYLIHEVLEDGPEMAYQLALPENKEAYDALFEASNTAANEDPTSINSKIYRATTALAELRYSLKHKSPTPPKPAAATPPKPTPPAEPPKREEGAPAPVRGRSAPTAGIEDIDKMDSDARRALKKAQGLM